MLILILISFHIIESIVKKEEFVYVEKNNQGDEIDFFQTSRKVDFDFTDLSKSENFTIKEKELYYNLVKSFSPGFPVMNDYVKTKLKSFKNDLGKLNEKEFKRIQRIEELETDLVEKRKQKNKEDLEKILKDEKMKKMKENSLKELIFKNNEYYEGSKKKTENFLLKSNEFKIKNQLFYSEKFKEEKKKRKTDWKEVKDVEKQKIVIFSFLY